MNTIPIAPDIKDRNFMVLLYRMDTDNILALAGKEKFKDVFKDPFEFEDPTSDIYWEKKATSNLYRTTFSEKASEFKKAITSSIKIDLNGGGAVEGKFIPLSEQTMDNQGKACIPLFRYDITSLVVNLQGFINDMDFNNSVSVEVQYTGPFADSALFKIKENDIMEIRVKFEGDTNYKTEFLGFITNRTDSSQYSRLNTTSFTAFGIQKLLGLTRIIEQPAVGESRMIEGVEINQEDFTGYSTVFSGLNAGEIFDKIMSNVLSYKGAIYEDISKQFDIRRGRAKIGDVVEKASGNLKKNTPSIKENLLISMDDIYKKNEIAIKKKRQGESPEVEEISIANRQRENNNITKAKEYLNSYIPAGYTKEQIIEKLNKDDKQVINNVVSAREKLVKENRPIGFVFDKDKFTSPTDYKTSFLALYGFFKVRELLKTDISQPDKDNKYKISNDVKDFNVTASIEEGNHKAYNEMTAKSYARFFSQLTTPISILETVRDTTFYDIFCNRLGNIYMRPPKYNEISKDNVINYRDILDASIVSQDASLKTHVDTKFMFPFIGEIDFVTGSYTDFNILFQYGMRLDNPINNPNVINPTMGGIFSALSLNVQNAKTRTMTITATNKHYDIGNLYIINMSEAPAGKETDIVSYVGYLIRVETIIAYGKVTSHKLTFTYVRKFGYEESKGKIKYDIGKLYNKNILSSAMLDLSSNRAKDQNESDSIIDGLNFTSEFYKKGWREGVYGIKENDSIRAFRRLPTILDVQLMIDNNPSLATPSKTDVSNPLDKKYLAYSEQNKYFVEDPWNSNPDQSYILDTITPYCITVDKKFNYFTTKRNEIINYGKLYGGGVFPQPIEAIIAEVGPPLVDDPRNLKVPSDGALKGLDTPFLVDKLTLSSSGSALLTKRMLKSIFMADIKMKELFFMFHVIDSGDYSAVGPTFDTALIDKMTKQDIENKITALKLKQSLIDSMTIGIKYIPKFENNYFTISGDKGIPPGNILGVATNKLSVNIPTSIEDKLNYYIMPYDDKTINIYRTGYFTPSISIQDEAGFKEAAKRIYFASPYFELNMERLQNMGWIWRGFSSSGEVPSSSKGAGYDASGNPHLQGRAVDILIKDAVGKLIPGVLEGTDWDNIQLFIIRDATIYLIIDTIKINTDKEVLFYKGNQTLLQDKDGLYIHMETINPDKEITKSGLSVTVGPDKIDKYVLTGTQFPFHAQYERKEST